MTNKSTKRALLSSAIALCLCFVMLVGTTFAWFTDEVTSSGNIIKTGTLDVTLNWSANGTDWNNVEDKDANGKHTPIFDYVLWEPGYTQVRYLEVANNGSLALKYQLQIISQSALTETVENYGDVRLSDVIDVYYATAKVDVPDRDLKNNSNLRYLGTLTDFVNAGSIIADELLPTEKDYATLVLQMQTSAGNEYQNLTVGTSFDIRLFATQYTHEEDSFDKLYDEDATFSGTTSIIPSEQPDAAAYDIPVCDESGKVKIGSVVIDKDSIADLDKKVDVTIVPSNYQGNFTIATGMETLAFDITATNLKADNTDPKKVEIFVGEDLDPATFSVYHYNELIPCVYTPQDGYVVFETPSFSPFTIVFDAESVFVPTEFDPNAIPEANVVRESKYENTELAWGSYGDWSPTENLDSELQAAYTFSCIHTTEEALASKYATWYCDFVVSLNKDLGENEIFLGGNYGSFGWVGFHNKDLTLDAETEVPLLGSVTSDPWTYADVAEFVGTFICGVGDVDGKLAAKGAIFTVELRLTNPENESETIAVQTVTYNFATGESNVAYAPVEGE